MDRSPVLRDKVLHAFQGNPWLFERLLQMHIGQSPLQPFGTQRLDILTG